MVVVEGIVEYPNSYSEGDWKQLGLDFGLIKEDKWNLTYFINW